MSLLLPEGRTAAPAPKRNPMLRRAILASAVGNATEWYDYGVYAVVATYLTKAFFPEAFGSLGTMLGFAVSFALQPLRPAWCGGRSATRFGASRC